MFRTVVRGSVILFVLASILAAYGLPVEAEVSAIPVKESTGKKSATSGGSGDAALSAYDTAEVPADKKKNAAGVDNDDVPEVVPLQSDQAAAAAHSDNNAGDKKQAGTKPAATSQSQPSKSRKTDGAEGHDEETTGEEIEEPTEAPNDPSTESSSTDTEPTSSAESEATQAESSSTTTKKPTSTPTSSTTTTTETSSAASLTTTTDKTPSPASSTEPTTSTTPKTSPSATETTVTEPAIETTLETTEQTVTSSTEEPIPPKEPIVNKLVDEGMPAGVVALIMAIVFVVVVICVYVGLIVWRRYLEHRYGNRELLVNDLEFDTNDLRHFENNGYQRY